MDKEERKQKVEEFNKKIITSIFQIKSIKFKKFS